MTQYRLEADLAVQLDVESAFGWYEAEQRHLGFAFLKQLRTAYIQTIGHPPSFDAQVPVCDLFRDSA